MANKFYQIGRRLEHRVCHALRELGFTCIRSAGSKSPFDIIAVSHCRALYLQVKRRPTQRDAELFAKVAREMVPISDTCRAALVYPRQINRRSILTALDIQPYGWQTMTLEELCRRDRKGGIA